MVAQEKNPGFQSLFIALAVVCVASVALFFFLETTVTIFLSMLGGGIVLVVVGFFLLRILYGSTKMPDGWAHPVLDAKKARRELGLPEEEAEKTEPSFAKEEAPTDSYMTDVKREEAENLAVEFTQMGRLLLKSGRYEEAKDKFLQAAEKDPGNSRIYNYLGISCGRLALFEESVDAYNKAIALDYDYASAHFNLASVYDQMGDRENAVAQWKRYLDVGQVVGERNDMLERARGRLQALKEGTDRIKKHKATPDEGSDDNSSW